MLSSTPRADFVEFAESLDGAVKIPALLQIATGK